MISSIEKFFEKLKGMREKEIDYKKKFYSHMKAEIENLRSNMLMDSSSQNKILLKSIRKLESLWEKIEAEMTGGVLIITRDPLYFWRKMKLWRKTREVMLAESVEEGIEICRGKSGKSIAHVNTIIVDPSVIDRFDDLERLKDLTKQTSVNEIKVIE